MFVVSVSLKEDEIVELIEWLFVFFLLIGFGFEREEVFEGESPVFGVVESLD